MEKRKYLKWILISALTVLSIDVYGTTNSIMSGISLPMTRVIYPESEKNGITFTITNNTDNTYLLQSRVLPEEDNSSGSQVPFIVVPPLARFESGESITLLIRQTGRLQETDRESIWRLALKTIPLQSDRVGTSVGGTSLILALQNNLKLFYRPDGLISMTDEELAGRLTFQQNDGVLIVTNPTPYHITFRELNIGNRTVEDDAQKKMMVPYGSARYRIDRAATEVNWSIASDNGGQTELHHQLLY